MVSLASPAGAMPPPPTPVKRPSLGLKRNSSYIDTDDEASLSSSTKKLRVAFSPNVDMHIIDDWNDKSLDLVKEEVRECIERQTARVDVRDDWLLQLLEQSPESADAAGPKLLKKYLWAVDARVGVLGECRLLVTKMLDLAWLGRDDGFVALFTKFLCDLASAHTRYIPGIMERLVAPFAKLPASFGRLPEETPVPRARMFARLHLVIKTVVRQVPSASNTLMRMLKAKFPNDLATTRSYLQYQKHILRLADEVPELRADMLAEMVRRLVEVDSQIQTDIEDLEEDDEERLLQRPASSDGNDAESDDSDIDSVSESEETTTEEEQRLREIRLKVAKMDGTLDLLFEYYTPLIEDGSSPESNNAYQQLLIHFGSFILDRRCRHTQFLQFHFSQTSPAHTGMFVRKCLDRATMEGKDRLTACAYLSSFVARGAHIQTDTVRDIMTILCRSLESMRQRYEARCRGPDKRDFGSYYAVAQAMLYIFCFRWRDLVTGSATPELDTDDFDQDDVLAEGRDLAWIPVLKETLTRNIYCKLNPLKVCSPAIVGEFAKIANHLRFLYVFPLLETNKRLRLGQMTPSYAGNKYSSDIGRRETAFDRKSGEAHHHLEAYFPFDPYHLPKSKRWVANDYNEWKLPSGMRQEQEYEEESEEEKEEEDDDESEVESVVDEIEAEEAVHAVTVAV